MICKTCKRYFTLKKENRYEVARTDIGKMLTLKAPTVYECFDCPKCGCQNIVGVVEKGNVKDHENRTESEEN